MDPNAYRDDDETDQPETYWRQDGHRDQRDIQLPAGAL